MSLANDILPYRNFIQRTQTHWYLCRNTPLSWTDVFLEFFWWVFQTLTCSGCPALSAILTWFCTRLSIADWASLLWIFDVIAGKVPAGRCSFSGFCLDFVFFFNKEANKGECDLLWVKQEAEVLGKLLWLYEHFKVSKLFSALEIRSSKVFLALEVIFLPGVEFHLRENIVQSCFF